MTTANRKEKVETVELGVGEDVKPKRKMGRPKKWEYVETYGKNSDEKILVKREIDDNRYFLITAIIDQLGRKLYKTVPIVSRNFPPQDFLNKVFGGDGYGIVNIFEFADKEDYMSFNGQVMTDDENNIIRKIK